MATKRQVRNPENNHKKRRNRLLFFLAFFSAVFLIVATYAWLSSTLNVKVKFFKMQVQRTSGLTISLDAINFDEVVYVSVDTIINDLKSVYPNHNNQWSIMGLWPVSSNGIKNSSTNQFDFYMGWLARTRIYNPNGSVKRLLHTMPLIEDGPSAVNMYIGFDVFFRNQTGSPKPDNLYFDKGTGIFYEDGIEPEITEKMDGLLHSVRIGLVYIGSVSMQATPREIQNISCSNNCKAWIFEPYKNRHSAGSIKTAENYGITLVDGVAIPTYAVIRDGEYLEHTSGHVGTGLPLDTAHFALQRTITESDFDVPLFQVPHGYTKARIYVWIEGQDIDSLETLSEGAAIEIAINFIKDLAGYE